MQVEEQEMQSFKRIKTSESVSENSPSAPILNIEANKMEMGFGESWKCPVSPGKNFRIEGCKELIGSGSFHNVKPSVGLRTKQEQKHS